MTPLMQNMWLQTECRHIGRHLPYFPGHCALCQKKKKGFRGNTLCSVSLHTRQALHCFLKCLLQAAFSMGLCSVLQIDKHIQMDFRGQNKGMFCFLLGSLQLHHINRRGSGNLSSPSGREGIQVLFSWPVINMLQIQGCFTGCWWRGPVPLSSKPAHIHLARQRWASLITQTEPSIFLQVHQWIPARYLPFSSVLTLLCLEIISARIAQAHSLSPFWCHLQTQVVALCSHQPFLYFGSFLPSPLV